MVRYHCLNLVISAEKCSSALGIQGGTTQLVKNCVIYILFANILKNPFFAYLIGQNNKGVSFENHLDTKKIFLLTHLPKTSAFTTILQLYIGLTKRCG